MSTVVLRGADSTGVVSVVELSSSAGLAGPPLHRHDFDDASTSSRAS